MMLNWLLTYAIIATLIIFAVDVWRRVHILRSRLAEATTVLELLPPASARKTPHATEQLFTALNTLGRPHSWRESLLGRSASFSLEVVSTRREGIRYLVRIAERDVAVFEQQLAAYLPDVRFRPADDYLSQSPVTESPFRLLDYRQARHYALPLAGHNSLAQHDPIAFITGAMTKLDSDELIAFQLVLSPVAPREVKQIRNNLLLGRWPNLSRHRSMLLRICFTTVCLPFYVLKLLLHFITEITRPADEASMRRYHARLERAVTVPSPDQQQLLASISDKLAQPLFQVNIRVLVASPDDVRSQQSVQGLDAALDALSVPGFQYLVLKRRFPNRLKITYRRYFFDHRLPSPFIRQAAILSVAEVASLYHFPYGETARPENLLASRSRSLAAPAELKRRADSDEFDVILGSNTHHGTTTPIGLTAAERERHVYVLGGTGNGKTTLLQYAIVQDIQNGKGVAVVDPHGELAETILEHIPAERLEDVVYFNPIDIDYPIHLNLLELPKGLSESERLIEQDLVTESIISVFRKVFSDDDSGGHRIEYVLRNAIHTAFAVPDATLFTIFRLLTDADYRKEVIRKLDDPDLKNFWSNELGKAGEFQRVKMSAGVTAKIGRFLFSAAARRILEAPTSSLNFDDILADGKILICNFSKGKLGEDTSALFGTVTLAKLQLAALRRARLNVRDRSPFYLYVDEFQNFATLSFLQMLSEARKYKLYLTMAEQSPSQQEELRMVSVILANVGTVICFRSASPLDEELLLPLFQPSLDKGEILNLPTYQFYMRLAAVESHEPMSGETLLLPVGDVRMAERAQETSRQQYGVAYQPPKVTSKPKAEKNTHRRKAVLKPAIKS